jgi:hypothetical protein
MYGAIVHACPAFAGQFKVSSAEDVATLITAYARETGLPGRVLLRNTSSGNCCRVAAAGPGYVIQHLGQDGDVVCARYLSALAFNLFSVLGRTLRTAQNFTFAVST